MRHAWGPQARVRVDTEEWCVSSFDLNSRYNAMRLYKARATHFGGLQQLLQLCVL